MKQRRWRILKPVEVGVVLRAFDELANEANHLDRGWIQQARVVFLTLVITGIRRHELQGLRWRDVDLIENVLRITDSKTEDGIRSIGFGASLNEALWDHRRRVRHLVGVHADSAS